MRILVVDEEIPNPLNSGKRIRTFNLLKPLASRHDITFVCRQHEGANDYRPESLLEIGITPVVVPHLIRKKAGARFYLALLANLFSSYPYTVSSHRSPILAARIRELLDERHFDLIHCEWTPYAVNIEEHFGRLPTVVDAHNVEAMIWRRNCEVETSLLKKMYIFLQWQKMAMFERNSFGRFTRCVAVSEEDARAIRSAAPGVAVDVVANGVDIDYFTPKHASSATEVPKNIVFTGSLDWRPNVDGLLYFLDRIFPRVQTIHPDCRMVIVGRNPMQVLVDRVNGCANVDLAGTVPDVRPYMEEAALYVVPLRIGGGSRLKILEALSMEMPVVSTTIGAEGLEVQHGEHIHLADTPEDFAKAISSLLHDRTQAKNLGERGRRLVEARYQWKILADRLEQSWLQAVQG